MGLLELVAGLAVVTLLLLAGLAFGMRWQTGRLLGRVGAAERQLGALHGLTPLPSSPDLAAADRFAEAPQPDELAALALGAPTREVAHRPPPGFPLGTVLFDFELPDLDGRQALRSAYLGRRLLLIFINPNCPHSRALLPDLARLRADPLPSWPDLLLVSTGTRAENRPLVQEAGLHETVLLQDDFEVADLLQAPATPMAYLVDGDGKTASALAAGRVQILGLAALTQAPDEPFAPVGASGWRLVETITTPGPTTVGRYQRGLDVGEPAPGFRLPRTDGGQLALEAYSGRPVLLIFIDPASPPCGPLAPRLAAFHAAHPQVSIALIGRGDPAANRAWADAHGLRLPLGIQRRSEVARAYRQLATPIAYLLDAAGQIAEPVALGTEAVVRLAERHRSASSRQAVLS